MVTPERALPLSESYNRPEDYIDDLLDFITTSPILQTLCGGVHILDFLTREDDVYEAVLPPEWRHWLDELDIASVLDSLMRQDLTSIMQAAAVNGSDPVLNGARADPNANECQRGHSLPPSSLIDYVQTIRRLSLDRAFTHRDDARPRMTRPLAAGMSQKKFHEVERFASFADQLASHISRERSYQITHLVDFGSGQNYLGRILAGQQYKRRVVAIERRTVNIEGAKRKDVKAKLAKKDVVWRNKKSWRSTGIDDGEEYRQKREPQSLGMDEEIRQPEVSQAQELKDSADPDSCIQYVQHSVDSGHLDEVIRDLKPWAANGSFCDAAGNGEYSNQQAEDRPEAESHELRNSEAAEPNLLVMSLHSCGNLIHHGLHSLILNSSVKAVAMVGCCYNLCTERLGPPTFKLPGLRTMTRRLEETSSACDPHGFPMSERFVNYPHANGPGIRFNITARMMAVQAPQNWTKAEYESFFTRHFFRALLQRILLDRDFVGRPENSDAGGMVGPRSAGEPVIIGSLRKSCYDSFVAYVRGALDKLAKDPELKPRVEACMSGLTNEEIAVYEKRFQHRRHHLCILWSLMAFSAGVVESAILVDRWLYLKEQPEVKEAWVQTVFEYEKSPRNLVVVGIKR